MSDDNWIRPDKPSNCAWYLKSKEICTHTVLKREYEPLKCHSSILETIGFTPMVQLKNISQKYDIKCKLYAKCEYLNPFGSVKDRIGYRMVIEAEKEGLLNHNSTIIEPTSGNTGIGLAAACAVKGYKCIIVIPVKMSDEKINVLKALGAEIYRTPTSASFDHPDSNIRVAQKLRAQIKDSIILDQYRNPFNPIAHYDGTAEEIIQQCGGKPDCIVIGAGTGGTISGTSRKIKEKVPMCRIIGVDPIGSSLAEPSQLNTNEGNFYEVEGLGYDFIPTVCDRTYIDEWIKVDDAKAFNAGRELIRNEALLVGGSSGSAMFAAIQVAKTMKEDQICVVLLPDSIRNYMTKYLKDDWMIERDFLPSKISQPYLRIMSQDIGILKWDIIESLDMNNSLQTAFYRMAMSEFKYPIPIVEKGEFEGCITIATHEKYIEGLIVTSKVLVEKYIERTCKKAFIKETSIQKVFYMLKNASTVFVLEKIEIDGVTKIIYKGQLTRNSFHFQLSQYFPEIEDITKSMEKTKLTQ